ncbi:MAG TPA: hypothetical protein VHE09_07630 [Rhizomicrobium sp.]|jgi:hypothetical protein|nr:hypothetical protein [Rhizomicrobium sp.]
MRGVIVVLALLVATPVCAEDFATHFDGRHHDQRRAFWLNSQQGAWPMTQPESVNDGAPQPRFTKTYVDGVVSRFSLGTSSHFDLFEQKLGDGLGLPAPSVAGTFDHGAAMLVMRWDSGE